MSECSLQIFAGTTAARPVKQFLSTNTTLSSHLCQLGTSWSVQYLQDVTAWSLMEITREEAC